MGLAPGGAAARRRAVFFLAPLVAAFAPLQAAPMLRLVSSTVGPVQLATAGPTNTQVLEAYNAGDGALNVSLTSSVPWITATLGAPRNCITTSAAKSCLT